MKWADMTQQQKLGLAAKGAGDMAKILGEETAAGKAMAVTQATIQTFLGAQSAFTSMSTIPVVGPALGAIAAAAAIAGGIANVKAIMSADSSGNVAAGGGGGSAGGMQGPAPQMMSGAFELGDMTEPEPVKAFVVTDEMTNSQDQLANIRRRSTI
jgi:Flp pilus assembly protein TadG